MLTGEPLMKRLAKTALLIIVVASLSACANHRSRNDQPPGYSSSPSGSASQLEFGVVSAIDRMAGEAQSTGGGAVVGGVTGAVVGRQFGGSSNGRALGTFLGAVAGVLIGDQVERQNNSQRSGVRVSVRLDNGGQRSFDYSHAGDLRIGERVRIEGNQIVRM